MRSTFFPLVQPRRAVFLLAAGLLALALFPPLPPAARAQQAAPQPAAAGKSHRALFEVTADGPAQWTATLNNVENLREALGPEATEIAVVVHGDGLGFLLKTNDATLQERMRGLAAKGVVFAACENTMKKKNVTKADLLPFVTTVDSGVAEVVRKQEAGWAYLKSGD